ncbi:hypothetical protein MASR2M8_08350 [Opitutaceae bacterium]
MSRQSVQWGITGLTARSMIDDAETTDHDGMLLPGGVMGQDKLRMEPKGGGVHSDFFDANKPVAALCSSTACRRIPLAAADKVRSGHSLPCRPHPISALTLNSISAASPRASSLPPK